MRRILLGTDEKAMHNFHHAAVNLCFGQFFLYLILNVTLYDLDKTHEHFP